MPAGKDLGVALAAAARAMHESPDVDATLEAIVESAALSVPGFDHVGVTTLVGGGWEHTRAASSELVRELDELQYTLDEGPCVDAMTGGPDVVLAPHLRHEQRWPSYVRQAVGLGLRAQMGVRLHLERRGAVGGLNLYSTTSDAISDEAVEQTELFATHAAIALGAAGEISGLTRALESRKVIGQALGILMERYDLDEKAAFAFISRASSHANVKLRDVASRIVEERRLPGAPA